MSDSSSSAKGILKVPGPQSTPAQQPDIMPLHDNEPLPPGWERRLDAKARVYYVDHNTKKTTWQRPIPKVMQPTAHGLPYGWEERKTPQGNAYFVDHNTETTTWADPRKVVPMREELRAARRVGKLPDGFEVRLTEGRIYFVNHKAKTTSWDDPRTGKRLEEPYMLPEVKNPKPQ
ncbi:hypothetical protein H1R20_g8856, partial [Candolleomyces eurysporus]